MEDDPALAVRRKKDSSLMRALELLREQATDAVISSGIRGTGRRRYSPWADSTASDVPRSRASCPSRTGAFVLLDGGANPDYPGNPASSSPSWGPYFKSMLGVENPQVGVLSNGTEESKGNDLSRGTPRLISQAPPELCRLFGGFRSFQSGERRGRSL